MGNEKKEAIIDIIDITIGVFIITDNLVLSIHGFEYIMHEIEEITIKIWKTNDQKKLLGIYNAI